MDPTLKKKRIQMNRLLGKMMKYNGKYLVIIMYLMMRNKNLIYISKLTRSFHKGIIIINKLINKVRNIQKKKKIINKMSIK